jgi:hypothetical protein
VFELSQQASTVITFSNEVHADIPLVFGYCDGNGREQSRSINGGFLKEYRSACLQQCTPESEGKCKFPQQRHERPLQRKADLEVWRTVSGWVQFNYWHPEYIRLSWCKRADHLMTMVCTPFTCTVQTLQSAECIAHAEFWHWLVGKRQLHTVVVSTDEATTKEIRNAYKFWLEGVKGNTTHKVQMLMEG